MDLYREQGIRLTSAHDVARRADVATATVLNHFSTTDKLVEAALARVLDELQLPTGTIFSEAESPRERVMRLVPAMFAFYDRSDAWLEMYQREIGIVPALQDAEARVRQAVQALYTEALGPLLSHGHLGQTVFGLTSPVTLGAMRSTGLTLDGASAIITKILAGMVDEALNEIGKK
ncbi:MAG: TetR/AcrR family transcriptional regulator [SAR202 cluster bacterium]|nr:TetR/AcrR family transcriptional regulator [SAR202 cluster bacterium]